MLLKKTAAPLNFNNPTTRRAIVVGFSAGVIFMLIVIALTGLI